MKAAANRVRARRPGARRGRIISQRQGSRASAESKANAGKAVVVGAGPVGLASAIGLAQKGWEVSVFERREDPTSESPTLAYGIAVDDARAGECFQRLGVWESVEEWAVRANRQTGRRVTGSGRIEPPWVMSREDDAKLASNNMIFFPRSWLVGMLWDAIKRDWRHLITVSCGVAPSIDIRDGKACATGKGEPIESDLLIAADGAKSRTREQLRELAPSASSQFDFGHEQFFAFSMEEPFKALRIRSGPNMFSTGSVSPESFVAMGTSINDEQAFRTIVLPEVEPGVRRAATAGPGSRRLCQTESVEEAYRLLELNHGNYFNVRDCIPREEMEAFVQAEPGTKPTPSLSRSMRAHFPKTTALLLGDSAHSVPPDLGQGANSGFEDVVSLLDALEKHEGDLRKAAEEYERARWPNLQALMELHKLAWPPANSPRAVQAAWGMNMTARRLASKYLPGLFDPPAMQLVSRGEPYKLALDRHRATSAKIVGGAASLASALGAASSLGLPA